MKLTILAAVAALTITTLPALAGNSNGPVCVGRDACTTNAPTHNHGGKGGSASARQSQGQAQGQIQGQSQSSRNTNVQANSQSVSIDTPSVTFGGFVGLNTVNNDPCGRVILGLVPVTGQQCNDMREAARVGDIVERYNSTNRAVKAGARAEMISWASTDTTALRFFRMLGYFE